MIESKDNKEKRGLDRRGFMELSVAVLATISGIAMGLPLIGSLLGSVLKQNEQHYAKVGKVDSLKVGVPKNLDFADLRKDAFIRSASLHNVWVIKNSDADVTVYSPICPHLGCRYKWDATSDHFICPCHRSIFNMDGTVIAGPSPRPLDTLPTKIENGDLYVEWEQFKEGIAQKEAI